MSNFLSFRPDVEIPITVTPPEVELSIIKRLGKPKFYVSNNDFFEVMQKIYKNSSMKAISVLKKAEEEKWSH